MKKLLIPLFSLFFLYSPSVIADEPAINMQTSGNLVDEQGGKVNLLWNEEVGNENDDEDENEDEEGEEDGNYFFVHPMIVGKEKFTDS